MKSHAYSYIIMVLFLLLWPSTSMASCHTILRFSWISELCYEDGKVKATMSHKVYTFCGMPKSLFNQWVRTPSVGLFYHVYIKDLYSC